VLNVIYITAAHSINLMQATIQFYVSLAKKAYSNVLN